MGTKSESIHRACNGSLQMEDRRLSKNRQYCPFPLGPIAALEADPCGCVGVPVRNDWVTSLMIWRSYWLSDDFNRQMAN